MRIESICLLLPVLCLHGAAEGDIGPEGGPISMVAGRKQLFLDDVAVQEITGLVRTMHQPEKRGAVLKPDLPTDGNLVQIRSAPMWVPDEQVYKLVYLAYAMDERCPVNPALAVSKDGVHWEKPIVGEVEVFGSKENNWLNMGDGLRWPENAFDAQVYDPDDPNPNRRYKGLLGAIGRIPVVSADCIHWTKLDVPPIPSSDEATLTYDREHGRFLAAVKTGNEFGRAFNISISEDFEHWTAPRFLFGADAEDQPIAVEIIRRRIADPGIAMPFFVDPDPATGWKPPADEKHFPTWRAECYNIGVFPYEGLYIGLPMMYFPTGTELPARTNTDGFDLIRLAVSRDLETWTHVDRRQAFIGPSRIDDGKVGVFDRTQLCVTNRPVEHGDELWFYYVGFKWRHPIYEFNQDGSPRDPATLSPEDRADFEEGRGAVCLAVLRRDGFVSLDADAEGGALLTRPLQWAGSHLFLNLDAPDGEARVEILDGAGQPVPGFSEAEAEPVTGDRIRAEVTWRSEAGLDALAGTVVQLRVHLANGRLYAFWTE
ncbi:MAG: hypothetical protein JXR94_17950 [Candidatus Hydrogenedentes bacterium]|nr:hypothetical protein [Candidatus Hydrogenedentota bacterium]